MLPSRDVLNQFLETAGKRAAKAYLAVLRAAILVAFPLFCAVGMIYLVAAIAVFVGGILGAILFLGVPIIALLFFWIYAWLPHVLPAVRKALTELKNSSQDSSGRR
jgi:hypothetical protein